MLRILAVAFSALFFLFACASTQGVNTKDYDCAELRQLIQSNGSLTINSFLGSTVAYANPRSCRGVFQRPLGSVWRTSDKTFCRAGFTCQYYNPDDDD